MLGDGPIGSAPLGSVRTISSGRGMAAGRGTAAGRGSIVGVATERDSAGKHRPISTQATPRPPRSARLLLRYLLPFRDHSIIGDLDEEFHTKWLPEEGIRHARRLYCEHAIRSIAPMLWVALRRSAIFTAIVRTAQWLSGSSGG